MSAKQLVRSAFHAIGVDVRRSRPPGNLGEIPDRELYRPFFSPWLGAEAERLYAIAAPRTLVSRDRCYVLQTLLRQSLALPGDVWECGVYKGGTAAMMATMLREAGSPKALHLFDTFCGMPETDAKRDLHRQGDFDDTSLAAVREFVPDAVFHVGFIPDTFAGLSDERIALAHVDLDLYQSVSDALAFIWPRLSTGGFVVFDDYGYPSCPGARAAVDHFYAKTSTVPLCLHTGQAIVFKSA
jgi:O-methyltransferase